MMSEPSNFSILPEFSGWLYKWTNYFRGYQKRWFVLSKGMLSYYKSNEEVSFACRGTVALKGAIIYSDDTCNIMITNADTYHLKARNEDEKHKWMQMLRLAKFIAEIDSENNKIQCSNSNSVLALLRDKLASLKAHSDLANALLITLCKLDNLNKFDEVEVRVENINERAVEFQAVSASMINACSEYLNLAEYLSEMWSQLLTNDIYPNSCLVTKFLPPNESTGGKLNGVESSDEEQSEYYDCNDIKEVFKTSQMPIIQVYAVVAGCAEEASGSSNKRVRRTTIPNKPQVSINLWQIIKNGIGKDLTKMPIPVHFCEPLSLLQRLTEDFEYAEILDRASATSDPGMQIALVAGFAVSAYSTTVLRTGKPFNPLLGETFECDRTDDLGWKSIAEQVSHHPPISAIYCEGKCWECWQEQSMSSKFRGTYLQVFPLGIVHLKFKSGNHYTWNKVSTVIHNVIIGKLWIDNVGDMEISCHSNGFKCKLTFQAQSFFGREGRKIIGSVKDPNGQSLWDMAGTWDGNLNITPAIRSNSHNNALISSTIWERTMPSPNSTEYYNFTILACQLNESEDGVAPTDSRNRPDQKLLEMGNINEANNKKIELEEKQRAIKKQRLESYKQTLGGSISVDPFTPLWFGRQEDSITHSPVFIYKGEYWRCKQKQDWSRCPNIY